MKEQSHVNEDKHKLYRKKTKYEKVVLFDEDRAVATKNCFKITF